VIETEYYPLMVISTRSDTPNRLTILGNIGDMTAKCANQILAENIRQLMSGHQTLGTQAALARKSGLAQSSIQRVITAAVHPQLDVIEAIARAFKVTPAELLTPHLNAESTRSAQPHASVDALSNEEKEKVASYIRFLLYERAREMGTKEEDDEFIRLADLRELSVDQLAQVMRPTLREPDNNTLTSHEADHSEIKQKKSRTSN
jgi:transcriptional regulator with XRE-family HTH domain